MIDVSSKAGEYGVEIATADGVFIKQIAIPQAGSLVPQHAHAWDHTTMLAVGAMRVWAGERFVGERVAPCALFIKAGVKHLFETTRDDTVIYCVHNLHGADAVAVLAEHGLEPEDVA